ncbi:uncharacterized protein RAG0_13577 [Rhynchosporium agropyri]|uniref:Uncharacterized protein n=1 Tax=Rhynchosporium agropyri TaxID=914238 RepID=A0A1E1LDD1_9HELO|nr:uncharacterized protein RAG0_13577 [Rhynchosporium agropyri]
MRVEGISALRSPAFNEVELMGTLRRLRKNNNHVISIEEETGKGDSEGVSSLTEADPRWPMNSETANLPNATLLGLLTFYLSNLPLPHISTFHEVKIQPGVVRTLVLPFVVGAEVVILPQFTMEGLVSTIERYKIAEVQVVPSITIRLVNNPIVQAYDLSCNKRIASSAAPINDFVKRAGREMNPTHELSKGPRIFLGYLDNPTITSSAFDSGRFSRTCDIESLNAKGCIVIHDSIKERLRVKGVQLAPDELEGLLQGDEMVEDLRCGGFRMIMLVKDPLPS